MEANDTTPRLLGAAFLGVIVTSLVSGAAADAALGSGSVSNILANVSSNVGTMRIAILAGLCNAVAILVLATLLYVVLGRESRTLALIGLLCWTGESFFYALNQIACAGLIRLSGDLGAGGSIDGTLAAVLYHDVFQLGGTILMFFYCAGGLLFYSLSYRSRLIPRWLSGFGILAVSVGLAAGTVELLGNRIGIAAYIAIGFFELATGVLLVIRGAAERQSTTLRGRVAEGAR